MNSENAANARAGWNLLSASGKLTAAALAGMAAVELVGVLVTQGEHPPIALVIELVLLGLAGLVLTRRWWGSGLAAVVSSLLAIATLPGAFAAMAAARTTDFLFAVLFGGMAAVAAAAGFRASVETYRSRSARR